MQVTSHCGQYSIDLSLHLRECWPFIRVSMPTLLHHCRVAVNAKSIWNESRMHVNCHLHFLRTSGILSAGASILSPSFSIFGILNGDSPPYGILPPLNISQHVTPNAHYALCALVIIHIPKINV